MSSWLEGYIDNLENLGNDEEKFLHDLSISLSLLDNWEKYYEGTENGSIQKDHVRSLKNGLQFLGKLYFLSIDGNLASSVKHLAADIKQKLTTNEDENGMLDIMKLDHAYENLRGMMMSLFINPRFDDPSFRMIQEDLDSRDNYRRIIDLLVENISEVQSTWSNNNNSTADSQAVDLVKNVRELRIALTYYKPLYRCFAHPCDVLIRVPLDRFLSKAVVAVYLLLVGKLDEDIVVSSLRSVMSYGRRCRKVNIYIRFLKFASYVKGQFYILDNLIHILAMNSDSLDDANNHLYVGLRDLKTLVSNVVENQRGSERLNRYLGPIASTEAICYQAVPIVYSCYMELVELGEVMRRKLNDTLISVIDQIKMITLIKCDHGSHLEFKVCDYPRVDDLGFLMFFLEHLKEIQEHEKSSVIRSKIEALHMHIQCLVTSPNTTQDKITSEGLWTHIVRLAYQAEYVIDLYLVIPDSRCISTLSGILEEVSEIKEKMLSLPDQCLSVEDVSLTTSILVHGTPLRVNNAFVGFHEEIDVMMNYLLGGNDDLQAITIVGMAGAGKTSLAMHLFKESSRGGHFDIKVWCTVSQSYQIKDLLLSFLNQINSVESDIKKMDDQELADELCRSLKRRRYLVVIDDVWDASLWNYLSRYFPNDKSQKSRILITTRDRNVASKTKSEILELRALTEDESWELLQTKFPRQQSLSNTLVGIAKVVAKSCKGLPLSISIIGGLMNNAEKNEEIWNQISIDVNSTILSDPQGKCEDILALSYNHLPNHLKSCLLYLGVFPEDCEISVIGLVRLWVAEGLVRGGKSSDECLEEVGIRYVDDLISRSLLIPRREKTEGGVKSFQLHDLLRDFCLTKAKQEHFLVVLNDRGMFDLSLCPRRVSIYDGLDSHLPFISLNRTRTVISFRESNFVDFAIERIMKSEHMMLLNVLDMHELASPDFYVHHFVHLRHLAIRKLDHTGQALVQSTISKLRNLQTLILFVSGNHVFDVPEFIWDLVKLRHIQLLPSALFQSPDRKRLEDSPVLLQNLKSLSKPRLHYGDSSWICRLPELQKLGCIFSYSSDNIHFQQYRFLKLDLCCRLTSLKVENDVEGIERGEGCKLQLPACLRKLSLSKFILNSDDISEIGKSVPNLEVLKLHNSIEKWSVNDEDFLKLKVLKINDWSWHEWDASEESFPSLEQLWLQSCRSLKEIPLRFGDITCLRIISIKGCNSAVYESAREIEMIQLDSQNLELKVHIS